MKLLILSTDPTILTWKSLPKKKYFLLKSLQYGKNADWETVDVKYINTKPLVIKEKIDHLWLYNNNKPFFEAGYDIIAFHMSEAQWKKWGIKASLRGANPNGTKDQEDLYFSADENSTRKRFNRFEQVGLHEISHGYYDHSGEVDETHIYHEARNDISGIFKKFDWSKYQPVRMALKKEKNRLGLIVASLMARLAKKPPTRLLHPVEKYRQLISQTYGVANTIFYPLTGHHIGTDYACPVGTPVLAPWDGEVTISGNSNALGNFCHYKYTFDGVTYVARFMHLSDVPAGAKYKRGELIELSGKTGKITGPHLHIDIFYNEARVDLLTSKNWSQLTINPQTHYV